MTDEPRKLTLEESFRSDLESCITIIQKLAPFCKTPEEVIGMAQLALSNDGQMRILMREVLQGKK